MLGDGMGGPPTTWRVEARRARLPPARGRGPPNAVLSHRRRETRAHDDALLRGLRAAWGTQNRGYADGLAWPSLTDRALGPFQLLGHSLGLRCKIPVVRLPSLLLLGLLASGCAEATAKSKQAEPAEGTDAGGSRAKAEPERPRGFQTAAPALLPVAATVEPAADEPFLALRLRGKPTATPAAKAERILHVGDSMVPLVANYLAPVVRARGDKYHLMTTHSTTILEWSQGKLLNATYDYDPDLILISLGSNDIYATDLTRRTAAIQAMVQHTRRRACMWIGPPLWDKDNGIVERIQKNMGHCRYFDSTKLNLPRMKDGRHPSWTGGYHWARAVWKALGGRKPIPAGVRSKP